MNSISFNNPIKILEKLEKIIGSANIAYFIGANAILTISGERAYCDGVFYFNNPLTLDKQLVEIRDVIDTLGKLTDITASKVHKDKNPSGQSYVSYDLFLRNGLDHSLRSTNIIDLSSDKLIEKGHGIARYAESIVAKIILNPKFSSINSEEARNIAFGILLGYPDKAILQSIKLWDKSGPFDEPLIDADIRGARYYICPIPVYSYPRHLVGDPTIRIHEQRWSEILKSFYESSFHKKLVKNVEFINKAKELELIR
jgi:hypothetical protein